MSFFWLVCVLSVRVQCYPCQVGWSQEKSSCYTASLSLPDYQKTWDEAQADCKEKISNLAVINNDREKVIMTIIWTFLITA